MNLDEIVLPIREEVGRLEQVMLSHLESRVSLVQDVAHYVIANGGKRLRPILTLLSARLSGCQDTAAAIRIGVAMEFIHTASLLHDDVLDNAAVRRGRATTNAKWGNSVSVLVGDFFYCRASQILCRQGDLKILKVTTDAITTTAEGEVDEIVHSNDLKITEADYLRIIGRKTAILMSAATQCGAILGRLPEEFEAALRDYGYNLGIAFQLADDYLDYVSSEESLGKQNGTDLKEGKLTLPLIRTLARCSAEEADQIRDILIADKVDRERFKRALAIINRHDGLGDTLELARNYVGQAKENLKIFKSSLEKEALAAVADFVVARNR